MERQQDKIEAMMARLHVRPCFRNECLCSFPECPRTLLHLHKACASAGQCLFEKLQCIIVVEDLDGVGQCHNLVSSHLLLLLMNCLSLATICLQVFCEFLVCRQ